MSKDITHDVMLPRIYIVCLFAFIAASSAADPSASCPNHLTTSATVHTFSSSSLCYNAVLEKRKWQDAHSVCREAGGNLVTIHDSSTQAMLVGQLRNTNAASWNFWIGLYPVNRYQNSNDYFTWVDGGDCSFALSDQQKIDCAPYKGEAHCTTTSGCCHQESTVNGIPWCYYPTVKTGPLPFDNWAPNEPSRDAKNSCVLLWHNQGWKWDDQNCDVAHDFSDIGYICQFAIPTVSTAETTTDHLMVVSTAETTTDLVVSTAETTTDLSPTTRPTTDVSCEKQISTAVNVIEGESYCYDVVLEALSWNSAYEKCRTAGGSLVAIKDNMTQTTLAQELSAIYAAKNVNFWIGLYPFNHEQEYFTWADGPAQCTKALASTLRVDCHKHGSASEQSCSNLGCCWKELQKWESGPWCYYPSVNNGQLPYTAWAENQPSKDASIKDFCVLLWSTDNWTWDDQSCENHNGYICQFVRKDLPSLPPTVVASTDVSSPLPTPSQTRGVTPSQTASVTSPSQAPSHTLLQTTSASTSPSQAAIVPTPSQTKGVTTPAQTPSLSPSQTSSIEEVAATSSLTSPSQAAIVPTQSQTKGVITPSQTASVTLPSQTPSHTLVQTTSASASPTSSQTEGVTTPALTPSLSASQPSSLEEGAATSSLTPSVTTPSLTPSLSASQTSSPEEGTATSSLIPIRVTTASLHVTSTHTAGPTPSLTPSSPTSNATITSPSQTASVTPSQTTDVNVSSTFSVTTTSQIPSTTNGSFQNETTPTNGSIVEEPQAQALSEGGIIGITVLVVFLIAVGLFAAIYVVRKRMLERKNEELIGSNNYTNIGYNPEVPDGESDNPVEFFNEAYIN